MLVAVRVDRVTLDPTNNRFIVILRDDQNHRLLPIVVGSNEAQAIALHLEKIIPPRPLTHDLMRNLLDSIDARIARVVVNDLRDSTYYALIALKWDGNQQEVDARPSDAIALALRLHAPIFVDEKVMRRAAIKDKYMDEAPEEEPVNRIEDLNLELQKAVDEERFEDAARLRDEIKNLKHEEDKNNN
jgi:bifunctional DNase/RNase